MNGKVEVAFMHMEQLNLKMIQILEREQKKYIMDVKLNS
jgi:hypothetical protein